MTFTTLSQLKDPESIPFSQGFSQKNFITESPQKFSNCFKGNQRVFAPSFGALTPGWPAGVLNAARASSRKVFRHLTPIEVPKYLHGYGL